MRATVSVPTERTGDLKSGIHPGLLIGSLPLLECCSGNVLCLAFAPVKIGDI